MKRAAGAAMVALTLAGCAWQAARAQPAAATFPGSDGRIILSTMVQSGEDNDVCLSPPCSGTVLRAIDSHTGRRAPFSASRCDFKCEDRAPEVSPNGRRVAFERVLPKRPPGASTATTVALTDGTGSTVRQILTDASDPAWSPTGNALAVVRLDGIHLIRPDGRRLRRLTTLLGSDLDWSVRGQIIFSRRSRGRWSLYAMRADGTGLRRLTREGSSDQPSWSPDGRRIAFRRELKDKNGRFAGFGIFVMRADGGRARQVARGAAAPVWSPDGERIAYSRGPRIEVARPDGTRRRVLYRQPELGSVVDIAWRPVPRGR